MIDEPTIHVDRQGSVRLASFNNDPRKPGWNWLQLRYQPLDGEPVLRDYCAIEHRNAAIEWANRSVEELKTAFFAIVEAIADSESDDCLGTIDVDLPHNGYPRQWLRDAARRALGRDPITNNDVEAA